MVTLRLQAILAALVLLMVLVGCGGSAGGGSGTVPGGTLTETQRSAAMTAIGTHFHSLPHLDRGADAQAMVAFLRTMPEVAQSGITADFSIWGSFKDGQPFSIVNNELIDQSKGGAIAKTPTARSGATRGATEFPVGNVARLYQMLGPVQMLLDPRNLIVSMLQAVGYSAVKEGGLLGVNVSDMRTSGESPNWAAVVFMNTHGGFWGPNKYAVWTDQEKNDLLDLLDQKLQADLHSTPIINGLKTPFPAVVRMYVDNYNGPFTPLAWHYAVTAQFVNQYMKFSANSFWYAGHCSGFGTDFMNACFNNGLSVYAGWDNSVGHGFAVAAALFLFDRMAGTSQDSFYPINPPQRPFDWQAIFAEIKTRNLDDSKITERINGTPTLVEAHLHIQQNPKQYAYFGMLAPTIRQVYVEANTDGSGKDTLFVEGNFGVDPGASQRSVKLGGVPLNVVQWSDIMQCDLPAGQPDLAGPCVVTVRGHKSNTVRVTLWKGPVSITYQGPGTLYEKAMVDMHLRYGIAISRIAPGTAPSTMTSGAIGVHPALTAASSAQLIIGGSYTQPVYNDIISWSVKGSSKLGVAPNGAGASVSMGGDYDPGAGSFTLNFECVGPTSKHQADQSPISGNVSDYYLPLGSFEQNVALSSYTAIVPLKLGADFSIPAYSKTIAASSLHQGESGSFIVNWPKIAPVAGTAPDPTDSQ